MIHVIIGTKAQLVKMAPVMLRLQDRGIPYNFIFTGQHQETMDDLRENFSIKFPDSILHSGKDITSVPAMFVWMARILFQSLTRRAQLFKGDRPHNAIVLVHGDTFSTLLGAVMGRTAGFKVAHVESGLRSFNVLHPFPEELTRIMTFWLSDVHFCPGQWAVENLKRFKGEKVDTRFNTLLDALRYALSARQLSVEIPAEPYCVVTTHRFENLYSRSVLEHNLSLIEHIAQRIKVLFILHPITVRKLREFGLKERLEANPRIETRPRYDYFNFIHLVKAAEFLVTDGGSNQEESYYLGKPCLLLRKATERTEGLGHNVVMSHYDEATVQRFVAEHHKYTGDLIQNPVSPTDIIVDRVASYCASPPV